MCECVELRPARLADEAFLYALYRSNRADEVAAWGWSKSQAEPFLKMQFEAQRRHYELSFPGADHRIVLRGERPAGRLFVARSKVEIRLVDIALLPEDRRAGVGSALIRALQAEAAADGVPLRLSVMKGNPAQRLYERLGFSICGDDGAYLAMEWRQSDGRGAELK